MSKETIQSVHFIGIGGVGMSGIARVAHDKGMCVTGSDIKKSRYTTQLEEVGITVFIGHKAENIPTGDDEPDVVVVSTAVLENNPELIEAKRRSITVWHRAQMLARLGQGLSTIAIAGTHGKTTTSSMVASTLDAIGQSPTFLIGGIVRAYGTNAHPGSGSLYVVEADESDKSFRYLSPDAVLITNIEADHLDHYRDLDEIYEKFAAFIASVPEPNPVLVCAEDEALIKVAQSSGHAFRTYGFSDDADITIKDYSSQGIKSSFSVCLDAGQTVSSSLPQSPGKHNVLNAAGALALLTALGFAPDKIAKALEDFRGVKRRFDLAGTASGVTVVDDYAHHPTEIAATIKAALSLDFKRVHVLFQPHRYSRASLFCEVLHDEFASAFDGADTVSFMDVFSAGETPIPGVTGKSFLSVVESNKHHPDLYYVPRRFDVVEHMVKLASEGDLIITMGAGDVTAIAPQIVSELQTREHKREK